ncbi:sigma-70 family RNA polymerase sigma factor [Balneolales bacterium ANBcel1]|nr:sigma-70 family RNA polymerase sigma factor [Balneolales bacterium ANBcel1]
MQQSSSDFSLLIEAILRDDRVTADQLAPDLLNRVILYLRVRMDAPQKVAEECVYQAFSVVFDKIREDRISDHKSVFKYLMTASRNEYLSFIKREKRNDDDSADEMATLQQPPDQLQTLIDQERQERLDRCLKKLPDEHRRFILSFFSSRPVDLSAIGKRFGFSYAKTRTLKTRIMQQLQQCVQKSDI